MKTQTTIATIIILTGSALTAWMSHDIAFPAVLCMLGLVGLQRRFTLDLPPQNRAVASVMLLVLAVAFSFHYSYVRPSGRMGQEAAMAFAWQTVMRYFLASMILMLFLGAPRRLPPSLGLFHVGITVCAGQILLLDDRFITFRLMEVGSVVLAVAYVGMSPRSIDWPKLTAVRRKPHWIAGMAILLLATNVAWSVSSVLYRHIESLNYVPIWFSNRSENLDDGRYETSSVGFSDSGKLSSLASVLQDRSRALTITSADPPGYLRAAAFEVYRQSEWSDLASHEEIRPEPGGLLGTYLTSRTNTFRLNEREPAQPKSMTIRHEICSQGSEHISWKAR